MGAHDAYMHHWLVKAGLKELNVAQVTVYVGITSVDAYYSTFFHHRTIFSCYWSIRSRYVHIWR